MKSGVKTFFMLCVALICCSIMSTFGLASRTSTVIDRADVLNTKEEVALYKKLYKISEKQKCEVAFAVIPSFNIEHAERGLENTYREFYGQDLYSEYECGEGYGQYNNGILFVYCTEDNSSVTVTDGIGSTAITKEAREYLKSEILADLIKGNYKKGISKYASICNDLLSQAKDGYPYEEEMLSRFKRANILLKICLALSIGIMSAFIKAIPLRKELMSVELQESADEYLVPGRTALVDRYDIPITIGDIVRGI